jgi:tetratricopeptide (TPR) repeat protein
MEIFWLLIIAVGIFLAYRITMSKNNGAERVSPDKHDPYKGTIQAEHGISLTYEVSMREKTTSEENFDELLKAATQKKNQGDMDGAVSCLKEAYSLLDESKIYQSIETLLRLPVYLQQAGRYSESVVEFEKLLANLPARIVKKFSHLSTHLQNAHAATERESIFDKMRLSAQREQRFDYAIYYQMLSDANGRISFKLHGGIEGLDELNHRDIFANKINVLLRKAKKESNLEILVDMYMFFVKSCTSSDISRFAARVASLLQITGNPLLPGDRAIPKKGAQEQYKGADDHLQWLGDAVRYHATTARQAWDFANYDFARQEYQKAAYAMTQIEGQESAKENLKAEQAQFANDDPLYNEIIPFIQKKIFECPGILQSNIYEAVSYSKEDIAYTLYFGAMLNDIRRKKKGRTYALYLPT